MTDFNTLPLTDQLKALEPGDELHLRGGGWLPFVEYSKRSEWPIRSHNDYENSWNPIGVFSVDNSKKGTMDIIRVIRPSEKREVPEIVGWLRNAVSLTEEYLEVPENAGKEMVVGSKGLCTIMTKLADHFEQDARK